MVKHKAADPEIKGSNPDATKEQEKKEKKKTETLSWHSNNWNAKMPIKMLRFCSGRNIFVFVIEFIEFF